MRLYMARFIKGSLIVVAAGFLFFQCSFLFSGEDSPPVDTEPPVDVTEPPVDVTNVFRNISKGITLSWNNPIDADFSKVLILRSASSIVDTPTTGQDYASVDSIGSSTVVYNSNQATLNDLEGLTNHYYKLFSYDVNFNYASGVEISGRGSADNDSDGLIEITDATMLNNMRYNLVGTSYKTSGATTVTGDSSGCPSGGCNGYELIDDIDLVSVLDKNGNGIDLDTVTIIGMRMHTVIDIATGKDESWMPIGDASAPFTSTFEGNNHTIANLWVNVAPPRGSVAYAGGLFGVTGSVATIRNVGVISGSIYSRAPSRIDNNLGGFVGKSLGSLTIVNSYFGGSNGVFASHGIVTAGGLVGVADSSLTIANSYFGGSNGVSSSTPASSGAASTSGGLVGNPNSSLTIINSYFNGGDVFASSPTSSSTPSTAGGLVGSANSSLNILTSYFSGGNVSASGSILLSTAGGLVGAFLSTSPMLIGSYWNTSTSGQMQSGGTNQQGTRGLTLMQLQATATSGGTHPQSLAGGGAWDLGTSMQLPAIKACVNPTIVPPMMTGGNITVTCASYGDLLAGQR